MKPKSPSKRHSFQYKSALIFCLTSILPLLLLLTILERHELLPNTEVAALLGLGLMIALVGFVFFRKIVKQISTLVTDLHRLNTGELDRLGDQDSFKEVDEIASFANTFNDLLVKLKDSTKELEGLIFKLTTLSELTELVSRIPDIREVLKTVIQRALATVNARVGSIMLLDENDHCLRIAAAEGLNESDIRNTVVRLGEGVAGQVAETGESIVVEDMEKDPRTAKTKIAAQGSTSFICMALRVHERIIGVLNLYKNKDQHAFSETDLRFLKTLLSHISFAVENARLLKEAKESAIKLQETVNEKNVQLDHAQQQVLQSAKLSALGELIAGVTHEINNPLTVIMGYSQLLHRRIPDERVRQDLKKITDESERAAKIVQNLLSFARQEMPEKRQCDINSIVNKVLEILTYDLKAGEIEIACDLPANLPPVMVDSNQLQQVFLNIVNNARHAMMEKEKPRKLRIKTYRESAMLRVEFSDTGPGIDEKKMQRIFDPFFTTKPQGKGTGLGLSISYGIVKTHNGNIYARNNDGGGATFVIEFPIAIADGATPENPSEEVAPAALSIRNILVIEDEAPIRDLICEILRGEGYAVESASAGDQGLLRLQEKDYDLVLCDMRMPGLNGQGVYNQTKQFKPHVAERFIFVTGDIVSEETQSFLEGTGCSYMTKPFSDKELFEVIKMVWDRVLSAEPAVV